MKHDKIQAHGYKHKCDKCYCNAYGPCCSNKNWEPRYEPVSVKDGNLVYGDVYYSEDAPLCLFYFGYICEYYKKNFYNK